MTTAPPPSQPALSIDRAERWAFATFGALLLLHLGAMVLRHTTAFPHLGLLRLVDVDAEANLPTLFSVLLLGVGSVLCFAASRRAQRHAWGWLVVAVAFAFVAVDEFAALHERLIEPLRATLGVSGVFYFAWVIPYGAATLALATVLFRWLIGLPAPTRRAFLLAATLYVGGALGLEMASGWYLSSGAERDAVWTVLVSAEESLEIVGLIVFAAGAARYLRDELGVRTLALR